MLVLETVKLKLNSGPDGLKYDSTRELATRMVMMIQWTIQIGKGGRL